MSQQEWLQNQPPGERDLATNEQSWTGPCLVLLSFANFNAAAGKVS
ncbi:hypothetical protein FOXB_04687 [Fusarium oxysporum f. sp. conglutinans Fo5176]|uniref:Uncharacterized protein n=1 Tax=Fusarium oxysporum (strain Fo5176) TaxID=660025 RepID=F9FE59_FUSOF|nr:hypothetical protein FOXB_04687 [Fusarium oxysporum f. sp. conglutinans Fo5176]